MQTIQARRNTAVTWRALNPILAAGEHGYEIGTGKYKLGNGTSRWLDLEYFLPESYIQAAIEAALADALPDSGSGQQSLTVHINSETPHPAYDDGPSLLLLYRNAKV